MQLIATALILSLGTIGMSIFLYFVIACLVTTYYGGKSLGASILKISRAIERMRTWQITFLVAATLFSSGILFSIFEFLKK